MLARARQGKHCPCWVQIFPCFFACFGWSNFRWCFVDIILVFLDIVLRFFEHHKKHGFLIVPPPGPLSCVVWLTRVRELTMVWRFECGVVAWSGCDYASCRVEWLGCEYRLFVLPLKCFELRIRGTCCGRRMLVCWSFGAWFGVNPPTK